MQNYATNYLIQKLCIFKMTLLYNKEEFFCTGTELLNFRFTLPLAKLEMIGARLVLNGLAFSGDAPVDIQLVTFLLLSNVSELSIETKTKKC